MAKTQYTRDELFVLRNHVPVDNLIKQLGITSKMSEGCFRFSCPICREFDTGVNPATNLARCFACEKNYNTIDLVMLVKKLDFIHSVKFLKTIYEQKNNPATPLPSIIQPSTGQPISIGNILKAMAPALQNRTEVASKTVKNQLTIEMLNERLQQIEHQVIHLTEKIKAIELNR
jgi:DNA primase